MARTIGGHLLGWAVRLTETLHLRWAVSRLVHSLPPPLRLRLTRLQVRLGYMQGLTLVPEDDLQRSYEAALRLLHNDVGTVPAAYLEFGVYVGTSMACMYRAATRVGEDGLRLVGFNSFQGMPEGGVDAEDDPRWREGELYSDLELTRRNLARLHVPPGRVDLVPGWFEESLTDETRDRLGLERATVVMVDCVLSSSTRVALDFCTPLIRDRTIVFFDDWAAADLADRGLGERAAFLAWLADHPEMNAEELPALRFDRSSRAFVISRSPSPSSDPSPGPDPEVALRDRDAHVGDETGARVTIGHLDPRPVLSRQPRGRDGSSSRSQADRAMTVKSGGLPVRSRARGRPGGADALDTSTPVLVLSASPRARRSPHGGLGILRSLGRLGIPVYIVDSDPRGPASYSKYVRGRFVVDVAAARPEAAVEQLLEVGARIGSRPLLIPTWDEASLLASDAFDVLSQRFLLPRQPEHLAGSLASKREMYHLARQHGVPAPEATFPIGIDDVRDFAERATFPVMLKGIEGNRLQRRAGTKMVIVRRPDELVRLYAELEDPDEPNLMLQEYIPGDDDSVWMFNGYFNRESDCLLGLTGRKLRQTPVYTGATSLGICVKNDVVDATTRRWMKQLGYRGILDIGYRYDARDGQYKVLDVNPRIGGTFRLFVARNGMDVARALYLDMTGQAVPRAEPIAGRKWMDERDVVSCLQYRRDHKLTLRQWAASLKGVRETVYFARDDLAPFWRAWAYALVGSATSGSRRRETVDQGIESTTPSEETRR